jgi:hypothetical protein
MQVSARNIALRSAVMLTVILCALWFSASQSLAQTAPATTTPPPAAPATRATPATGTAAQTPRTTPATRTTTQYRARTPDGRPNLSGIWQAMNTAEYDIQAHDAKPGPLVVMGAWGGIAPDVGVVEGGPLPYRPEALAKKKENEANALALDPEVKCFLPGVPRATYMGFPFQITQSAQYVAFTYGYDFASRVANIGMTSKAPVDSWMGWSSAKWDGDTLVVDVTGQVEDSWFDRAGDYHSDELHVIERYTPTGPNSLLYEATIDDPKVFTRPWKMSMPLYRRLEKNIQMLDYNCVPFVEELMYGHLRKVQTPEEKAQEDKALQTPSSAPASDAPPRNVDEEP